MTDHRATAGRRSPGLWLALRLLGGLAVAVTALACGGRAAEIPDPQLEADLLLFERGTTALEEGDWTRARDYFLQIRDNYPQSRFRADARLAIGDTYEGEGTLEAYVQALQEYQDFLSLNPTHPRAAYAQFKSGMVHFHQMRRAERDQTETLNAIREFETFLLTYPPDHDLRPQVEQQLREARDRLSEHDYVVGHFYYRFKNYAGAISRFRQIIDKHPGYTGRDAVFFHLAESHAAVGQATEAIPYFARILEEFEASEFSLEAAARIAALEAEVNEDR